MFSATRLHVFVCIALGISVSAAPAGAPGSNIDARSPDTYDLSGGLVSLLLGVEGEGYSGNSDEDTYILKRQQAGLDTISRLGANMGVQHAAALAAGAGLTTGATIPKRDIYDLTGGIGALILGADGFEGEGGADSDEYILKRQLAQVADLNIGGGLLTNLGIQQAVRPGASSGNIVPEGIVGKRDTYDLTGGIGALLFGYPEGYAGEGDEDTYILKRQLPATAGVGSLLGSNMGIQHAVPLAEAGLGLGASVSQRDLYDTTGGIGALLFGGGEGYGGDEDEDTYILKRDESAVEARSPDLYDLTGGIGALIFGAEGEGYDGANGDEDTYILKRDESEVEARSPDLYDLTGGLGALIFGAEGEGYGGDADEDTYILKRQLGDAASLLGGHGGSAAAGAADGLSTGALPSVGGGVGLASGVGLGL
ncbi:unnamed protein product [Peniophora sp. CBMAI 1063]|nr:unnamed protein product [Peniophora sp. CBMAI 1063]